MLPGSDAGVLRIKGTRIGVAVTTDCNARFVYLDPRAGTAMAVAEAARNLSGQRRPPLGLTDCLNFGSPERPEILWQFKELIAGLTDAIGGLKLSLSLVDFERAPEPELRDTVRGSPTTSRPWIMQDLAEDPLDRDSPLGVLREPRSGSGGSTTSISLAGGSLAADWRCALNELAAASNVGVKLREVTAIPFRVGECGRPVKCSAFTLLYVACEGRLIAVVPSG